jgi:phosphate transport system protein
MTVTAHTTKAFDSDLEVLSRMLAEMGQLAERQIAAAITALTTCDKKSAHQLVATDAAIDSIQRMIDKGVIEMIARRQPVADDLRQVLSILRIAHDLERIGDLAKNIGKRILALGVEDLTSSSMLGVSQMAAVMLARLRQVLDSFGRRDQEMAVNVWISDEDVDHLCTSLFSELVNCMTKDPSAVMSGIHLLFCTKNLERMGDHATNIAESVYYMVEGKRLLGERPKADVTSMKKYDGISGLNGGDYSGQLRDSFRGPALRGSTQQQPAAWPGRQEEPARSSQQGPP